MFTQGTYGFSRMAAGIAPVENLVDFPAAPPRNLLTVELSHAPGTPIVTSKYPIDTNWSKTEKIKALNTHEGVIHNFRFLSC